MHPQECGREVWRRQIRKAPRRSVRCWDVVALATVDVRRRRSRLPTTHRQRSTKNTNADRRRSATAHSVAAAAFRAAAFDARRASAPCAARREACGGARTARRQTARLMASARSVFSHENPQRRSRTTAESCSDPRGLRRSRSSRDSAPHTPPSGRPSSDPCRRTRRRHAGPRRRKCRR